MAGLWCTNAMLFVYEPDPSSVRGTTFRQRSTNPRAASMLETTHAHLPIMSMVALPSRTMIYVVPDRRVGSSAVVSPP